MAATWGLVLSGLLYLGAPWISQASGLKGESLDLSIMYLRLLALASPFSTVLSVGAACLRGSGDTRTPFFIMIVVNTVNATVSVALASSSSPWGGYGLKGVAIGTVAAWITGFVCILWQLAKGRGRIGLQARRFRLRGHIPRRLIRVGLPSLLENSGQWIGNFIVIAIVGRLAFPAALGAHVIAIRIEALSFMPGFAMGLAAATLAGQYLGVNDPRTARRAVWWCYLYGGGIMAFLGLLFFLVPDWFVGLVTDKREFLEACPPLLSVVGLAQPGFAACLVFSQAMRGAGDTRTALVLTYASTFLVRLPLVWLLGVHYGYGLWGVWVALSVELIFRGLLFLFAFLRGRWANVSV
jgi:putative MATE family efflux protein